MLRRLKADFDLEALGMPTFRAFAQRAVERGLIVATTGAHPEDIRFSLPEGRPSLPEDPVALVPALADQPTQVIPYLANLVKCIAEAETDNKIATGARIHPMLQDAISNYDLKSAGVDSFKKLVVLAEELELVKPTWNKGDFLMSLGSQGYALLGRTPPVGGPGGIAASAEGLMEGAEESHGQLFTPSPEHVGQEDSGDRPVVMLAGQLEGDEPPLATLTRGPEYSRAQYMNNPQWGPSLYTGHYPGNIVQPRFAHLDPAAMTEADATDYRMFITQQLKLQQPLPPVADWEPVLELAVQSFDQINYGDGVTLDEWKNRTLQNARAQGMRVGEVIVYKLLLSLRFAQCLVIQVGSGQYDFRVTGFHKDPSEWADAILRNFGNQLIRLRGHTTMDPAAFALAFIGPGQDEMARARRILDEI
jgi:hypothetical protein